MNKKQHIRVKFEDKTPLTMQQAKEIREYGRRKELETFELTQRQEEEITTSSRRADVAEERAQQLTNTLEDLKPQVAQLEHKHKTAKEELGRVNEEHAQLERDMENLKLERASFIDAKSFEFMIQVKGAQDSLNHLRERLLELPLAKEGSTFGSGVGDLRLVFTSQREQVLREVRKAGCKLVSLNMNWPTLPPDSAD